MNRNALPIPENFRDTILRCFKADGEAWLKKLPDLLETLIRRWELTDCRVEKNLSIHYICYAHSQRYGDVVLKTGVPHLELYSGMDALIYYNGRYSCRVYEADREHGAMLMERVSPGTRLRDEADFQKRIKVGTELAEKLPLVIHEPHNFPLFQAQMEKAFNRARREGCAPDAFISMLSLAEKLYEEIKSLDRQKVLLHGDMHHENILKDAAGNWKVIDPQGRIGEHCLEAGRFLLNEWGWFDGIGDLKLTTKCLDAFADALGESRRTIASACFLDYALSSCWSLEDGSSPEVLEEPLRQMTTLLEFVK
ncbi:MAG: aminoglycoside phosphotransferase family protein [Bacillota bacterium]|nr:aminoglycoside phosphotransferase family protein [Bacillota bacterium]